MNERVTRRNLMGVSVRNRPQTDVRLSEMQKQKEPHMRFLHIHFLECHPAVVPRPGFSEDLTGSERTMLLLGWPLCGLRFAAEEVTVDPS